MLRCTIWISSHDFSHSQHLSLLIQPRHIIQRHNTLTDFITVLNYTSTISPLPPRLPTSLPFNYTIPSTPPVTSPHYSHVPPYLPAPWQLLAGNAICRYKYWLWMNMSLQPGVIGINTEVIRSYSKVNFSTIPLFVIWTFSLMLAKPGLVANPFLSRALHSFRSLWLIPMSMNLLSPNCW